MYWHSFAITLMGEELDGAAALIAEERDPDEELERDMGLGPRISVRSFVADGVLIIEGKQLIIL